ncbi:hypothetical protein ABKN59_003285 [Abortiporus biennis]
MGTSLWLVPPPDKANLLSHTIMSLKTPGAQSPSSYPHFDPHITLATVPSSTPIANLRASIPHHQKPIPIRFKSLEVGSKYFMSVYVAIHHSPELVTLRENLQETLGNQAVPPLAHVSLFYIDDSDADERQKMADKLAEEGRVIVHDDESVTLDLTEGDKRNQELLTGFEGGEIWIAVCDGPVPTWKVAEKIKL